MSIPPLISTRPRTAFDRISLYFQTYIYIIRPDAKLFLSIKFNKSSRYPRLFIQLFFLFLKMPKNRPFILSFRTFYINKWIIIENPFRFTRIKTEYFSNECFQQFFQSPIIVEISGNLARRKWSNFISDRQRFRRLSPQREGDRR